MSFSFNFRNVFTLISVDSADVIELALLAPEDGDKDGVDGGGWVVKSGGGKGDCGMGGVGKGDGVLWGPPISARI